jgi:hypothetical protein
VERPLDITPKALLKNANGWPPCIKTTLTPPSLALVSIMNGYSKLGRARIGVETKASFKAAKADSCSYVHTYTVCFLSRLDRGLLMTPKFLINFL